MRLEPSTARRDPLHWLTMDECGPTRLHSGSKTEDAVYKGPLGRNVVHGKGRHLSFGQRRHRLPPGQGAPSRPEALKAEHRPGQALNAAVILLDPVVVPAPAAVAGEAPQLAVPLHLAQRAGVTLEAVGHALPWVAGVLATKRLAEETSGGLLVALGAEPEVDGLPGAVDGAVEVAPLPVHSHVRLIDLPRPAARSQVPPHPLLELGREALDPAVHGRVIDLDPTIGQHPLEVTVADRELEVPAHRPQDDL